MKYPVFIFILGVSLATAQLTIFANHHEQKSQPSSHVTWPDEFDGTPLLPMPMTEVEKNFQRGFPGKIATFRCGDQQIIFRHISKASRKLHPSADCLRASGHQIGPVHLHTDHQNRQWAGCSASKSENKYLILERIIGPKGNTWTDASAWYWHALLHPNTGPWLAQTIIRIAPSQTQAACSEEKDKTGF